MQLAFWEWTSLHKGKGEEARAALQSCRENPTTAGEGPAQTTERGGKHREGRGQEHRRDQSQEEGGTVSWNLAVWELPRPCNTASFGAHSWCTMLG